MRSTSGRAPIVRVGAFVGCVLLASACGDGSSGLPDGAALDAPSAPIDAMMPDARTPDAARPSGADILFVIDNSTGMGDEQEALISALDGFVAELETQAGGVLPSVHVGVVTTDLGAPFSISSCGGVGDGATLQGNLCGLIDRYIIDEPDGLGGRTRNYATGTLSEQIGCTAQVGTAGCGFEQPLEAMRRALDGSVGLNAGFFRSDSVLAVVIVSDEDDCSASDPVLFDPSLGPLISYRCFQHGVVCDPDTPDTPGDKNGCVSREDSAYLFSVQGYVDFLESLRPPGRLIVATISGPAEPVSVTLEPGAILSLDDSCTGPVTGGADPAVRLEQFASSFGQHGSSASTCDSDYGPALSVVATAIAAAL